MKGTFPRPIKVPSKGISIVMGTIIMLIVVMILVGMTYMYITGQLQLAKSGNAKYCEAWCITEGLEYGDMYGGCRCLKCVTKQILDRNVTSCETVKYGDWVIE